MTPHLVILRPEPGASASAERAERAGWRATKSPLFKVIPLEWPQPDPQGFDAVLMTSANAARHGGIRLARYNHLPLYAVGAKTAEAARARGFDAIIAGDGGVAEIADRVREDGIVRLFHPCGNVRRPFSETGLEVTHLPVYAADVWPAPGLADALRGSPIVLLHSPGAANAFVRWCEKNRARRAEISLVAISAAALDEAGSGWRRAVAAARPDDDAMLEAAAALASSL